MSKASLREQLRRRVQHLNTLIIKAEREFESSDLPTHVKLAGELQTLHRRKTAIEARLARLNDRPDGALSDIKAELIEDADDLALALQRWLENY